MVMQGGRRIFRVGAGRKHSMIDQWRRRWPGNDHLNAIERLYRVGIRRLDAL
jgi:hypothetical protein